MFIFLSRILKLAAQMSAVVLKQFFSTAVMVGGCFSWINFREAHKVSEAVTPECSRALYSASLSCLGLAEKVGKAPPKQWIVLWLVIAFILGVGCGLVVRCSLSCGFKVCCRCKGGQDLEIGRDAASHSECPSTFLSGHCSRRDLCLRPLRRGRETLE